MADDSALRATLKELKVVADSEDARGTVPSRSASPIGGGGGSLLADLLAETSGEAQRELDGIKKQLEDRRLAAEADLRRQEDVRREKLDVLRAQEAERRDAMIRKRSGQPETAEVIEAVPDTELPAPAPAAAPARKKSNVLLYVVSVLLLVGAGVGGWWFMGQQGDQRSDTMGSLSTAREKAAAEAATARAIAQKVATEKAEAARLAEEAAAEVAHHASLVAMVRGRVESEADGYPRRMVALQLGTTAVVAAKAKPARKPTRSGKATGRKPRGKRIKIRGLDLGGSR